MKVQKIILSILVVFTVLNSGCKDDLTDKYTDPESATEANIPSFFTGMLDNDRVRSNYWNVRTILLMMPGVYTQANFYMNSSGKYQANTSYTAQYWNNFYVNSSNGSGALGVYRAMETAYADLSEDDQSDMDIFMHAAKIVLIDEASKMVDMWGDIPYSEAGSLITSSSIDNAAFDDQVSLYTEFISDLADAADYFASASDDDTFTKYDILNSGDLDKWQRYANSLRLRLLMRISNYDESTAQSTITTMLSNSSSYPLIDGDMTTDYSVEDVDILLQPLTDYTDNLNSALTELPSHYAPDYLLNTVMKPVDDPRIPVMFDKYGATVDDSFVPNDEYNAMPIDFTEDEVNNNYMYYSIVDSATFLQNAALPGIVMTASEVNFLKAEAYERWGLGDAQAAFETAVKQSVQFYYYLNNINESGLTTVSAPASGVIDDFVSTLGFASVSGEEQLAMIYVQKWLHFGFLQSIQSWAEYRRTGYPELTFEDDTKSGYETPPTRLLYPDDEKSYNADNYSAVQDQDTRDTKIFWDVN